jgi:hypothetical protein
MMTDDHQNVPIDPAVYWLAEQFPSPLSQLECMRRLNVDPSKMAEVISAITKRRRELVVDKIERDLKAHENGIEYGSPVENNWRDTK